MYHRLCCRLSRDIRVSRTYLVFQTIFDLTNLSQVNAPLSMCKLEYCKKFALIDNKIKPKRFSFIIFAVVVDLTDNIIVQ